MAKEIYLSIPVSLRIEYEDRFICSVSDPDPGGSGFFPRSGSGFETRIPIWIRLDPDFFKDPDSGKKVHQFIKFLF